MPARMDVPDIILFPCELLLIRLYDSYIFAALTAGKKLRQTQPRRWQIICRIKATFGRVPSRESVVLGLHCDTDSTL